MKNILFLLFFVFSGINLLHSQTDSLLLKRLSKPIINCEIIATNSQELLVNYNISQADSINQILDIWESYCGETEPILRTRILVAISNMQYSDSVYDRYVNLYLSKFKYRYLYSDNRSYYRYNASDIAYFDYVPIKGPFDEWTKLIAQNLLISQKACSSEYLLCLLFSQKVEEFEQILEKNECRGNIIEKRYNNRYNEGCWAMGLKFTPGIWIPMGQLSQTFKPNVIFGLEYCSNITESIFYELGLKVGPVANNENFDLFADDSVYSVDATVFTNINLCLIKRFEITKNASFEFSGGIGLANFTTNLEKPNKDSDSEAKYSISTVDIVLGSTIKAKIFNNFHLGFNVEYHYAPFELDDKAPGGFGCQYVTAGLVFELSNY